MKFLQEEDEEEYGMQFRKYIEAGVGPDEIEGMFSGAHAAIRKDPAKKRDAKELGNFKTRAKAKTEPEKKSFKQRKTSVQQKKNRVVQKLTSAARKAQTAAK